MKKRKGGRVGRGGGGGGRGEGGEREEKYVFENNHLEKVRREGDENDDGVGRCTRGKKRKEKPKSLWLRQEQDKKL